MAVRVTLIRFVISALPLYLLSLFKAPKTVCNGLIKIQHQFLWVWGHDRKKLTWELSGKQFPRLKSVED